ncbi:DNA cytosine methyltransferase [Helicobacter cetorum]|nr:DNA cytosine methyltransferase [Helicobacter cetorum]
MGFCDSFKIVVSDTAMYQQAGNSIGCRCANPYHARNF